MNYEDGNVKILIDNLISKGYCPDDLGLTVSDKSIENNDCNEERQCLDCWEESLNN